MLRNLALFALLVGVCASALYVTSGESQAAAPSGCQELYNHEPVLIYDVTGGTLTGPIHAHLTVYGDGFATYSSVSGLQVSVIDAQTAHVSPEAVRSLMKALTAAGAYNLCDQPIAVSDVPLKTITVLRGGADAIAHSYSYWLGFNEYAAADAAVNAFVQAHFSSSGS